MSVTESSLQEATNYELLDPDVRLMLQVRDDDAQAFEELVLRYQSRLVNILAHLGGSPDQAEDLAQEVFLRVFRSRKRYQPGAKFSTWLFTIANNVARNALRSKSRRHEVNLTPRRGGDETQEFSMEHLAQEASGLMPARQLDKAEIKDIVLMAMDSLNERQRMALLLSKFEGMSYQEIAEVMELSIPAIKSLLSRARVNLKDILIPYMKEGVRPQ